MRRDYPDPKHYLDTHIQPLASYTQEAQAVRDHNINEILKARKKRMNTIKGEGWSLRLKFCHLSHCYSAC